jgi:hypothetical protein
VHGGRQVPGARDGGPTYAGRPAPRRHDEHAGHASPGRARREEDRHAAVPAVDRSERPWRPVTSLPGERLARDTRGTPHGPGGRPHGPSGRPAHGAAGRPTHVQTRHAGPSRPARPR